MTLKIIVSTSIKLILLTGCVMFFKVHKAAAAQSFNTVIEEWQADIYNPQPNNEEDVILPMPCGGSMAFRQVETEASGLYKDQSIHIGDLAMRNDLYKSNQLKAYIAGNFTSNQATSRYYLIGKYEVTKLQYDVVMSVLYEEAGELKEEPSHCPEINKLSALPKIAISWFDAVEFSKRYSLWLHQQHQNKNAQTLPMKDEEMGFVRLPTEVEWEFAARGGLPAIAASTFKNSRFFSEEEASQYAWYSSSNSANGNLHKIGLLKANPLGIYDILGNAGEIVFDLFHLTHQRDNSPHGEAGGYVVRGGGYNDDINSLYSAFREEISFFQDGKLHQPSTAGFRVVVSSPVITQANTGQLREAWLHATDNPDTPNSPIAYQLSQVSEKAADSQLKSKLNELSGKLAAEKANYEEQLNLATREALRSAALLCQKLFDTEFNLTIDENEYLGYGCRSTNIKSDKKGLCDYLGKRAQYFPENKRKHEYNKRIYGEAIENLAGFGLERIKEQKMLWLKNNTGKEYTDINRYPDILLPDVEQYSKTKQNEFIKWSQHCINKKTH